jgi:hypothetical protein
MKNYQLVPWLLFLIVGLVVAAVIIAPETSAANISNTRIQQGQTVHVNDTIDITGVLPPYPQLAYWDGYNMFDSPPTYIIKLPINHTGWYNFYVDPAIFSTRLGAWYKYDSNIGFESNGNNLAFVVVKQNIPQVTINATATTTILVTSTPTPLILPTYPISTPTTIITPTPTPWNFEKGDYAMMISVTIVGLLFVFFTLFESKFWSRK